MTNHNDQQLLQTPEALAFSDIAESIELGTDGKIALKEFLHNKGLAIKEIALDSSGNVRQIELHNLNCFVGYPTKFGHEMTTHEYLCLALTQPSLYTVALLVAAL